MNVKRFHSNFVAVHVRHSSELYRRFLSDRAIPGEECVHVGTDGFVKIAVHVPESR